MAHLKNIFEKIILMVILVSVLIGFCAVPSSYAKLDLKEDEFYYAGTQKGQYTVTKGIFERILESIGQIADWLLGIMTMGYRMVFVGWTALFEKILTWGLESTSGMTASGEVVESNTDLTAITDSSSNVTIEAIVYNHVAALDANMFKYERTLDDLKYSPTGHLLKCEKDSCKASGASSDITACCSEDGSSCSCMSNGSTCNCKGCRTYREAVKEFNENKQKDNPVDPVVIQIKKAVAMWYYIIRFFALIAMLIVLIITGIKMATKNIAEEKAVYKRMLVDWLVGMIVIFGMHYIMLFTVYMNETMVGIIEKASSSVVQVQMRELSEQNSQSGIEYSNEEIELKVYEAVRTRAYDPKLINGMSGTVMYMTLVFFAFKYTIIYLKRFFTIIILTVMAPAVGVGYAMQKTLTGKQTALKTWLSEYVLNMIIQMVHALIYAIFISQALVLSLNSIAGVIIALILMNYTLKADQLFRKIFRISTGTLEENNNSAKKLVDNISQVANTAFRANMAKDLLLQSPASKGMKGIAKAAVAAPVIGAGVARNGIRALQNNRNASSSDEPDDQNLQGSDPQNQTGKDPVEGSNSGGNVDSKGNSSSDNQSNSKKLSIHSDDELLQIGKVNLEANLENAKEGLRVAQTPEEQEKARAQFAKAAHEYNRFEKITTPTSGEIILGNMKRIISVDNNFDLSAGPKGIYHQIYGNTYKDPITGKRKNDGTGYYNQFRLSNILGLTDADKKIFAKELKKYTGAISGIFMMGFGMASLVANPTIGMGLLATGASKTNAVFGRSLRPRTYTGKYKFSRFSGPAVKNMSNIAIRKAQKEYNDLMVDNVKTKHPKLAKGLKIGGVSAVTLSLAGGHIVPATLIGAGMATTRLISNSKIGDTFEDFNKHFADQEQKQEEEFRKETRQILNADYLAMLEVIGEKENQAVEGSEEKYKKDYFSSIGYTYDESTGNLYENKRHKSASDAKKEELMNELEKSGLKEEDLLSKVKPKQELTAEEKKLLNSLEGKSQLTKEEKEFLERARSGLTKAEANYADVELDRIINELSAGKKLDINSEDFISIAKKRLADKLILKGIIKNADELDSKFIQNGHGLKQEIKNRGKNVNIKIEAAEKALLEIDEEDRAIIKDLVSEQAKRNHTNDYTKINAGDVVKNLDKQKTSNNSQNKGSYLSSKEKKNYEEKVVAYLESLEMGKNMKQDKMYQRRNEAKKEAAAASKRREKKLAQIFEMTLDTDTEDPTKNIIDQVKGIKNTGGIINDKKGNTVEITPEEANRVLDMLFIRKDLESLNTFDMRKSELKKGSQAYLNAKKAASQASIDYYKAELEIKRYADSNSEIYNDKDYEHKTDVYTEEQIKGRKKIEDKEKSLKDKEEKKKQAERNVRMVGPVVNLKKDAKKALQ